MNSILVSYVINREYGTAAGCTMFYFNIETVHGIFCGSCQQRYIVVSINLIKWVN